RLLGADHTDRFARAVDSGVFPGPGVFVAVDVGEVIAAKRSPPESLTVDEGLGMILRFVGRRQVCDDGQHADASKNKKRSERFHSSSSAGRFKSEPPKRLLAPVGSGFEIPARTVRAAEIRFCLRSVRAPDRSRV